MMGTNQDTVTDCHQMATLYLNHPPEPRLSVLAIGWYEKALTLEPENVESYLGLAKAYHHLGQSEQALQCCDQAIALEPDSLAARYFACMLQIPIIYRTQKEVLSSRHRYHSQLLELHQRLQKAPTQAVAELATVVGTVSPFYLIYQGYDDTELQRLYGDVVCHIMAARYPQWYYQRPLPFPKTPVHNTTEPLRIGIVFGHFHNHSVWKVILKGWLQHLNHERFQLFGYSLGTKKDHATDLARSLLHSYTDGTRSIEAWGQIISTDHPHVLLYPEVSMDKISIQLSALRLAPIQCTTWGTYVTSGLPTMDYYLSGDLLEPRNAQHHHTEKLIRLPNLSIHYTPSQVTGADLQRQAYGLRSSSVVYLCLQSLFKYLPQYDRLYPQIAKAVGDCQFVFLKHKSSEALTRIFENRLRQAFSDAELDMDQFVVMQPTLSDANYHRLNALGDIFLDSIDVAGTTTTLEAITHDLPVVTMPGEFVRGRVSSAILQQMGVISTVATSVEHYGEIAICLGRNKQWRQVVTEQMAQNKHRLYDDLSCVEALEKSFFTFLEQTPVPQHVL
ncbi:tetratricopeptide repeat protein [Leptothoe sp. EHU-05/26/07-4]